MVQHGARFRCEYPPLGQFEHIRNWTCVLHAIFLKFENAAALQFGDLDVARIENNCQILGC